MVSLNDMQVGNNSDTLKLSELDVFFISYDEPNAEANWTNLLKLHASAKRVHRVQGFDKAHKTCAMSSTTRRLVIVDGDNWVNPGALTQTIDDTDLSTACFSFKSMNAINGLEYGNGGIKVWNKDTLLASNTHESADTTDFCWDIPYYQVNYTASTTVQNCTPFQAWRAGYREGVKMSYINGAPVTDWHTQQHLLWKGNTSKLSVWCTIGRDVENGIWSMLGARQGLFEIIRGKIQNSSINDYNWFVQKWQNVKEKDPDRLARMIGHELSTSYNFTVPEFDNNTSIWFKNTYINPARQGLMK
jgi:hypothetical protein